jgi:hypothetical protein
MTCGDGLRLLVVPEELEHARQQLERDRAALDAATASQPTHAL